MNSLRNILGVRKKCVYVLRLRFCAFHITLYVYSFGMWDAINENKRKETNVHEISFGSGNFLQTIANKTKTKL